MVADIYRNKHKDLRLAQVSTSYPGCWLAYRVAGHFLAIYILATVLAMAAIYFDIARTINIPGEIQPAPSPFCPNADEFRLETVCRPDPERQVIRSPAVSPIEEDKIQIEKAFPVFVLEEDAITEIWTPPQPVRTLLKAAGFVIDSEDRVEPEGSLYPRAEIRIFKTKKENSISRKQLEGLRDANLNLDRGSIEDREGLTEDRDVVGVKGAGAESEIVAMPGISEYEAIDIITTGRKISQVFEVTATAYCPGTPGSGCPLNSQGNSLCTGCYNDGYTCTGKKTAQGEGTLESPRMVAVDPRIIPLASTVYLEGIGFAVAEDIGGAIKGNRIDLLFDLHKDACEFGLRKGLTLYLLAES